MKASTKQVAGAKVTPLRPPAKCPICGKPAVREYYPFSSRRCADADLSRWLSGGYVIPAVEEDETDSEAEAGGDGQEDPA